MRMRYREHALSLVDGGLERLLHVDAAEELRAGAIGEELEALVLGHPLQKFAVVRR